MPDGIQIIHDSPEWHALRAKNVGGSEVAALFDCQPAYALSRYALWHVKAGNTPAPEVNSIRAVWGLRMEAAIADAAAEQEIWKIRKGGYVTDMTTPGLGCTLDWVIEADPDEHGPGCMEVKNADWLIHKRQWTDEEPPLHILLQLQHQLAATGYSWGVVACLVGGNDLRLYRYKARPKLIADIRRRVTEFWASIAEGKEPKPDGSDGAAAIMRALYPEIVDEIADLTNDNELPALCADLLNQTEARKKAEEAEADLKAQIMGKLGTSGKARTQGFFINLSVTPENPGRLPKPGELIGKRKEVRKLFVKESAAA